MRRNPDLLRDIMLSAESFEPGRKVFASELKNLVGTPHEIADHIQQLIECGYLEGTVRFHGSQTNPTVVVHRVTSSGHDFLQAMRDDTIWKKVKQHVLLPSASWTLGLAVEYAKQIVRKTIGIDEPE